MASGKAVNLTEGNITRQILDFAWPVFVSSIFTQLFNITNSMIVGNYVSLNALSAVSACTWICNIFNFTFYGLGMGAGIIIARYHGAGNREKLKRALDSSIVFAVIGGIGLALISELFLPVLMAMCNIGPDIYQDAAIYLRLYMIGCPAVLTYHMCFFILRSFGDTRHQLYYSMVGSAVNITLGIIFVRVLHLNVAGTALATIIAQFVMDGLALHLMFNYDGIDFDVRNIDFSLEVIWEVFRLGIPASFQNMLIAISSMLVQSYVNLFPNEVISGIGVAEKIASWGQMVSTSVSAATMAMVAQNIGAGKPERAREVIKKSLLISTVGTLAAIIALFAAAPVLVRLFNRNEMVVYYGTSMIRYSIFAMFFINLSHVCNGACRGAGNVGMPMVIAIAGQVVCKYLFVRLGLQIWYDVHILYLGSAFGYLMAGILAFAYFSLSRWTREQGLR